MKPKRYSRWIFLFIVLSFHPLAGYSLTIEKSFLNIEDRDESDLIWDFSRGVLVSPIHVRNFDDGSGFRSRDLDPGDGRHGVFDISTYQNFSVSSDLSGNVITINTNEFPDLQFTQFRLEAGWVLRPSGDQPLSIKVLGEVFIDGVIDCSGGNGEEVSLNTLQVNKGGTGVCGGGRGGDGGSEVLAPTSGLTGGQNVSGGSAGPSTNPNLGQGGGGGGAYGDVGGGVSPKDGDDSVGGTGGLAGTQYTDDAFDVLGGGSGGGGGSAHISLGLGNSSGGGGGAGGGVVILVALGNITIGASGAVLANGGSGGGSAGAARAGGGGGGGGGSITMFSAGDFINNGTVEALPGLGGVTVAANSGDGGDGGNGRTWLSDNNIVVTGGGSISPLSFLLVAGVVRHKLGSFYSISKTYDLYNSYPSFTSAEISADLVGGSEAFLELSFGGTPNFVPSEWFSLNSVELSGQRYFRFRVGLNNQSSFPSSQVNSVKFDYDPYKQNEFKFAGGCGRVGYHDLSVGNRAIVIVLLLFPLLGLLYLAYNR